MAARKKLPPPPTAEEIAANASIAFEERTRKQLRTNAFVEMSPYMFAAIEDLIRANIESAAARFDTRGEIRDNRLRELRNDLIQATALASALLETGECLR
jgi:hypothetical protein